MQITVQLGILNIAQVHVGVKIILIRKNLTCNSKIGKLTLNDMLGRSAMIYRVRGWSPLNHLQWARSHVTVICMCFGASRWHCKHIRSIIYMYCFGMFLPGSFFIVNKHGDACGGQRGMLSPGQLAWIRNEWMNEWRKCSSLPERHRVLHVCSVVVWHSQDVVLSRDLLETIHYHFWLKYITSERAAALSWPATVQIIAISVKLTRYNKHQ